MIFLLPCLVVPLAMAASRIASSSSFVLYAYGSDLGGLPLFQADGLVYAGDYSKSPATDATPLNFTVPSDRQTSLLARPANDATSDRQWYLYVPTTTSTSGDEAVGVSESDTVTDGSTTGFRLYGNGILFDAGGSLQARWYVTPSSDAVFALGWRAAAAADADGDATRLHVALRAVAPSVESGVGRDPGSITVPGVVVERA